MIYHVIPVIIVVVLILIGHFNNIFLILSTIHLLHIV